MENQNEPSYFNKQKLIIDKSVESHEIKQKSTENTFKFKFNFLQPVHEKNDDIEEDDKVNEVMNNIENQNDYSEDKKNSNEFKILNLLHHLNVIEINEIMNSESPKFESLEQAILNKKLTRVQQIYSIYQITQGMNYIHSQKIVHKNLNPSNIFIMEDGIIKIGDFKNAQIMTTENKICAKDDVYAFGEIVYYILSEGQIPDFENNDDIEQFSSLGQQLIRECCFVESEDQPTFKIICDVLEENNFDLLSLSQEEIQEVSEIIEKYKEKLN